MASASNAVSHVICPFNTGEGGCDSERLNRFSEITQLESGRALSDPVCLIRALAGLNSIKFSGISCGGVGLRGGRVNTAKKRPQGQCDVGPGVGSLSVGWGQSLAECCKITTATFYGNLT